MKIPVANQGRLTSCPAGEHVRQSLGNLCLQYLVMDHKTSATTTTTTLGGPHDDPSSIRRAASAWWPTSQGPSSVQNPLPDETLFFPSSMHSDSAIFPGRFEAGLALGDQSPIDNLLEKETPPHLQSSGGRSSFTDFSEEELRLAEVNPVTSEIFTAASHLNQRPEGDSPSGNPSARDQPIDLTFSAQADGALPPAAPRFPTDDVDALSDGDSVSCAIYLSECNYGRPSSPGTNSLPLHGSFYPSEDTFGPRVKLMCSFGGKIMPRPIDGKLRYVAGETRIVTVSRDISYADFMSKMTQFYGVALGLKYQLPDEDLDALVSVSSDDDLQNMMEECDKLEAGGGLSRLRLFLFSSAVEYEACLKNETDDRSTNPEQRYVDAINGIPEEKNFGSQLENDVVNGLLRQGDGLNSLSFTTDSSMRIAQDASGPGGYLPPPVWSVSSVHTFSRAPSAPSSSPSSPPVASRQAQHSNQQLAMADSSLQIFQEQLNRVSINPRGAEGNFYDVDQEGSGSSSNTSPCEYHYRMAESQRLPDSPTRTQHEVPLPRSENWRIGEGAVHRVDSQGKLTCVFEHHKDLGAALGFSDPWSDVPETLLPQVDLQRLVLQQQMPQQQQPAWQMEENRGRVETMQHCLADVHQQPQAFQQPQQAAYFRPHQTVAGHDGNSRKTEQHAVLSFIQASVPSHTIGTQHSHGLTPASPYQGSAPSSPRIVVPSHTIGTQPLHGLTPASPYQGSAPSSPRIVIHDMQGRCNCGQQHSQVHRAVNVSFGDQSYHNRRLPHFADQPMRKHGPSNSSRYCDNLSHPDEHLVWQQQQQWQQSGHFTGPEAGPQEQMGISWQHVHERGPASQNHFAESLARTHAPQHCGLNAFSDAFLQEANKTRCPSIACQDQKRQPIEKFAAVHPVYSDVQDQVGDWAIHQRNPELDDARIPAAARLLRRQPAHKDEDWSVEFELDKCVESDSDLYCNHRKGEPDSLRSPAMPVGGVLHTSKFSGHAAMTSRTLATEGLQISQTPSMLAAGESDQLSRLAVLKSAVTVHDSRRTPIVEPAVWHQLHPSANAQAPHRLMDDKVSESPLFKAISTSNGLSAPLLRMDTEGMWNGTCRLDPNPAHQGMLSGKYHQDPGLSTSGLFLKDDCNRPNTASRHVGGAAAELLPVSPLTLGLPESSCENVGLEEGASVANAVPHLLSHDLASLSALASFQVTSAASHPWPAFPPATLNMGALEESLAFPIYDQSPLSSLNTVDFCFEPSEASLAHGAANLEKEVATARMSGTELLADDMISSVLESGPKEARCKDKRADHVAVTVDTRDYKEEEKTSLQGTENDVADLKIQVASQLCPSAVQAGGVSVTQGGAVNDLPRVSLDAEQSAGVLPVKQKSVTEEVTYEEKDAEGNEAGTIGVKDPNGCILTQAEAEATARGLQTIKNADLEEMRELGSGTFGTVYHGKWRGSDVAIKRIKASCFTGRPSEQERLISDFWKEACTLGQLHHPNVVAFYGVVPDGPGGTLATVTEFMVNGSLKQVLHKKDRTIDRRKRLLIAMDAAFGMEYLHSKNIVHFDLKCENLLVNMRDPHRPICKVGDFGLSKVKHRTLVSGGVRGTLPWMAPELLSGISSMVTEKIDVFSFGIVMWELLTGEEPYANMHCGQIIGGIVNNTLRPQVPSWCEPAWRLLMERCWSGDPANRPSFSEVASNLRGIAASLNLK